VNNGTGRESARIVKTPLMTLSPPRSGSCRKGALHAAVLPSAGGSNAGLLVGATITQRPTCSAPPSAWDPARHERYTSSISQRDGQRIWFTRR